MLVRFICSQIRYLKIKLTLVLLIFTKFTTLILCYFCVTNSNVHYSVKGAIKQEFLMSTERQGK